MKNIILTTDFSDSARNSILYAIEFFGDNDVAYTLVNAYSEPQIDKDFLIKIRDILEKKSIRGLQDEYVFIKNCFPSMKLRIDQQSIFGEFPDIVSSLTMKKKFNYIVKGANGKQAGWYIGSEVKSMVQKSKVPILVIPKNAKYEPISKIAYANTSSIDEPFFIKELLIFAEAHKAHVTMLQIRPNTSNGLWSINELKENINKSNYKRVMFEELFIKNTIETIVNYAEKNEIDILVINNLYIFL